MMGPMAGQLHAPGLKALLTQLVSSGQPGLCLLTTREHLQDLEEYERSAGQPAGFRPADVKIPFAPSSNPCRWPLAFPPLQPYGNCPGCSH